MGKVSHKRIASTCYGKHIPPLRAGTRKKIAISDQESQLSVIIKTIAAPNAKALLARILPTALETLAH